MIFRIWREPLKCIQRRALRVFHCEVQCAVYTCMFFFEESENKWCYDATLWGRTCHLYEICELNRHCQLTVRFCEA